MTVLLVAAVLLHGFSYDFVFISGYLYVDRHVREEVRAQAQGMLVVFTQGIGFLLSSQILVGRVAPALMADDAGLAGWQRYWLVPALLMAVVLIAFWLLFHEDARGWVAAPADDTVQGQDR